MQKRIIPLGVLLLITLSAFAAYAGGTNGPEPVPTFIFAEFDAFVGGAFNWSGLFQASDVAYLGGGNGPDPIPTIQILIGAGEAPAFDQTTWSGWTDGLSDSQWSSFCHWIHDVSGGANLAWPSDLPW